jgi:hypothetical protein
LREFKVVEDRLTVIFLIVATALDGKAIKVCKFFVGMLIRLSQIVRAGENMGLRLA